MDAIVEEIVYIAKPSLRATASVSRGTPPSVLCNIAGMRQLQWLQYDEVFSNDMLPPTGNSKYINCGPPPDYLRRPGIYGCVNTSPSLPYLYKLLNSSFVVSCRLANFKNCTYKEIAGFNSLNMGYGNFGNSRAKAAKKRLRLTNQDKLSFAFEPIVISLDDWTVERKVAKACDTIANFVDRHRNKDKRVGGLKIKEIGNFTNSSSNIIGGYGSYKNTVRHSTSGQVRSLCLPLSSSFCFRVYSSRYDCLFAQRLKTAVWAMYDPNHNQIGTQVVSMVQFIDDLKTHKVSGASSFEILMHYAFDMCKMASGLDLDPRPVVVHFLDQHGEVEFNAHTDCNKDESDDRVSVSCVVKIEDGFCHGVGFWPCGCAVNDECAICEGDTHDEEGRLKVRSAQHFTMPYRYGKSCIIFDANQRHMTKAINLGNETGCKKLAYFFATREAMKSSELKMNKKRKVRV